MRAETEGRESQTRGGTAKAERVARVIDSFIDLVLEGNTPPTPEQVRERAGVSSAADGPQPSQGSPCVPSSTCTGHGQGCTMAL